MAKSRLKWNILCGVLRHDPYVIQIEFGANFAGTIALTGYSPRLSTQEEIISVVSSTRLREPHSGYNHFLCCLFSLVNKKICTLIILPQYQSVNDISDETVLSSC